MMRLRRLACLALVVASGCLKENLLFDPHATGSGGEGSGSGGSTVLTQGTGDPGCPEPDPPAADLAVCELDALSPLNVGTHPVFSAACDGTPVTVWAMRNVDTPTIIDVCDEDCATCTGPNPIDLNDPAYSFLSVSNILPPAGECMKVAHSATIAPDNVCRTNRLTLWSGSDASPRFAAGIDSLDVLPDTGITLELGHDFLCDCSEADRTEEVDGALKYPCCVQSPIRSNDVLLTPEGGCPVRILRGPANLKSISTLDSTYDFILHNAYRYELGCAAARATIYWTMTRTGG